MCTLKTEARNTSNHEAMYNTTHTTAFRCCLYTPPAFRLARTRPISGRPATVYIPLTQTGRAFMRSLPIRSLPCQAAILGLGNLRRTRWHGAVFSESDGWNLHGRKYAGVGSPFSCCTLLQINQVHCLDLPSSPLGRSARRLHVCVQVPSPGRLAHQELHHSFNRSALARITHYTHGTHAENLRNLHYQSVCARCSCAYCCKHQIGCVCTCACPNDGYVAKRRHRQPGRHPRQWREAYLYFSKAARFRGRRLWILWNTTKEGESR
jgi:hypothetical protein